MSISLIPDSHLDLISAPGVAVLSTLSADQSIQSSLVWFDYEIDMFTINIVNGSVKAKNLARNPQATLLIMDRQNVDRYLSVRCEVSRLKTDDAIAHLNMLTRRNSDYDCWYGGAVDNDPQEASQRVIVCLQPLRVYSVE